MGALAQMAERHRQSGQAVLALEEVPLSQVHQYGIVRLDSTGSQPWKIQEIVEKPAPEKAPSNWSVVGRYILTPNMTIALKTQKPGAGGEIQLTDAIAACLHLGAFIGHSLHGKRFDCGSKRGFLEANMHFGLRGQAD